jgi:hypothetical protein
MNFNLNLPDCREIECTKASEFFLFFVSVKITFVAEFFRNYAAPLLVTDIGNTHHNWSLDSLLLTQQTSIQPACSSILDPVQNQYRSSTGELRHELSEVALESRHSSQQEMRLDETPGPAQHFDDLGHTFSTDGKTGAGEIESDYLPEQRPIAWAEFLPLAERDDLLYFRWGNARIVRAAFSSAAAKANRLPAAQFPPTGAAHFVCRRSTLTASFSWLPRWFPSSA